jgi:hypothetical protein
VGAALGLVINANLKKDCVAFVGIAVDLSKWDSPCLIQMIKAVLWMDIESLQTAEKDTQISKYDLVLLPI